jgi:hypothetical protein
MNHYWFRKTEGKRKPCPPPMRLLDTLEIGASADKTLTERVFLPLSLRTRARKNPT